MKTGITINQLKSMSDSEIIEHGKKYMFPSQWGNKDSLKWFQYHIVLIQGSKYLKTGNINSFKKL